MWLEFWEQSVKSGLTQAASLMLALIVALSGCMFWTGQDFFWAGGVLEESTARMIGVGLIAIGVSSAFLFGRTARLR